MGLPTTAYYPKEQIREVSCIQHVYQHQDYFQILRDWCAKHQADLQPPAYMRTSLLLVTQDGTQKSQKVFVNIPTEVGATEAEEIGTLCPALLLACSMQRAVLLRLTTPRGSSLSCVLICCLPWPFLPHVVYSASYVQCLNLMQTVCAHVSHPLCAHHHCSAASCSTLASVACTAIGPAFQEYK